MAATPPPSTCSSRLSALFSPSILRPPPPCSTKTLIPWRLYHDGRPRGPLRRGKKMIGKKALFVILGLKRFKDDEEMLDKFCKSHVLRLLKMDKIAVITELERQDGVALALKIDWMENMLSNLQTTRKHERFCSALRNNELLGNSHQKRKSEARSLQDKLLFEQVKLQLKRLKLHLLHNKAQSYQLRYRECHHLKSMLSQLICGTRASQTHETNLYSGSIHSSNKSEEVTTKKHELEMQYQELSCLVKSLEASCKIKGIMDYNQIIEVLNQNLRTRNRCTVIRQDLQLWELSDTVKKNDCSEIVLNYCNLLCQRFTKNVGQVSSIMVENSLNESNIGKNFPKMNAHLAFGFVFNAKGAQRLADSKCFQHKTLATSLLLGTLFDVIKEVQVSQRELWNLVGSTFYSQCPGELELQLPFFNFKSCGKVTLGLDMTRLGCGVYPSKSSELQLRIIPGSERTLPQSTLDEIMSSVQSLQDGRPMLLKLCRRISELVQIIR